MISARIRQDLTGLSFLERMVPIRAQAFTKSLAEEAKSIMQASWSASSPSSPGEYPAKVTGTLDESINVKPASFLGLGKQGTILSAGAPYSGYLEEGTSRMEARPFFAPSVELAFDNLDTYARAVYELI